MISVCRINKFRSGFALLVAGSSFPLVAVGQPDAAARRGAEEIVELERYVVTGSAIPMDRQRAIMPHAVFSDVDMDLDGSAMLVESLRALPGFYGEVGTEQRSNAGSGGGTANFRGLGGTLMLLDDRRTMGNLELQLIPRIAVSRVEVLKDGASARYGADALAGVFNPLLVRSFEGAKIDTYYGNTTDKDAGVLRTGLIVGHQWARTGTSFVLAAEYYKRNALMAADREVSATGDGRSRGGQQLTTSTSVFSGRVTARRSPGGPVEDLVLAPGVSFPTSASDYVSFEADPNYSNQLLNLRQYTPSIPAQTNRSLYARVDQQIFGERLEAYARILYSENVFDNFVTPGGTSFARATALTSPHVPAGLTITGTNTNTAPSGLSIGTTPFRAVSLGNRTRHFEREAADVLAGLKGSVGETWQWDAAFIYTSWARHDTQGEAPVLAALNTAIANGSYNPFALDTASGVSNGIVFDNPGVLRSVSREAKVDYGVWLRGLDVRAHGDLLRLPGGPLQLGFGSDFYREKQKTAPDEVMYTYNSTSGQYVTSGALLGILPTTPSRTAAESVGFFAELLVPLVGPTMDVPAVHALDLSLSGRYDRREVEGTGPFGVLKQRTFVSRNPRVGLRYEPHRDVALRGNWGTGFRTPFLHYLFSGPAIANTPLIDPLGFPAVSSVPVTFQGNANLEPEKSTTWSTGVVYAPKAIRGLHVSVDYYYGRIDGLVGDAANFILNANAAGQGSAFVRGNAATVNPNAPYADRITRNSAGQITAVNSFYRNNARRQTTGVDTTITYAFETASAGKWTSRLDWNTTLTWDLTLTEGQPSRNHLGRFGDIYVDATTPGSIPRNRGYFTEVWERGPWTVSATANYISHLEDDITRTYGYQLDANGQPVLNASGRPVVTRKFRYVEEWLTFDAQVAYAWRATKFFDVVTTRIGVMNLTDEPAPFATGSNNDSYDQVAHSNRGRFIYAQLTVKF